MATTSDTSSPAEAWPYRLGALTPPAESKSTRFMVTGVLALQLVGLVPTSVVVAENLPRTIGWTNSGWTSGKLSQSVPGAKQRLPDNSITGEDFHYDSTASAVRILRDISGLTWEQLAKLFSVSRRAVHLWATGKTMNAGHQELLSDLLRIVRALPGNSPAERRLALLRPGKATASIYDQLRMDRANAQVLKESSFWHVAEEARRTQQ